MRRGLADFGIIISMAYQEIRLDPLYFFLQISRRIPSKFKCRFEKSKLSFLPYRLRVVGFFLLDRSSDALEILDKCPARSLYNNIRVHLGIPPLVNGGAASKSRVQARYLWKIGECAAAIETAPKNSYLQRYYTDDLKLMQPGRYMRLKQTGYIHNYPENNDRPRILHLLTNSLPYTQSGYSIRSHEVLRSQAHFADTMSVTRLGYPTIIGKRHSSDMDTVDGITYQRVIPYWMPSLKSKRLRCSARRMEESIEKFRPDILCTTTNYENAIIVESLAYKYGLPWIYEMRGELENTWLARFSKQQQTKRMISEYYSTIREREVDMAKKATMVVVLSQVQKQSLVRRGVDAKKITVIPNAVPDDIFSVELQSPKKSRKHLGLPEQGFWVGAVSSLVDYEGFDILLEAVAQMRSEGHDVRCLLVGDGAAKPALEKLVRDFQIDEYVVMPGKIPYEDVAQWYQALDCFIVPRKDTPVCRVVTPIKPLTAVAFKRPVIASDLPALREILHRGASGFLFTPGSFEELSDLVIELKKRLHNPIQICKCTHNFSRRMTWSYNGDRYERLCKTLRSGDNG
ncbi:MAG: glycosyltransferase family 4 protein [Actinomycetaceae bacterium]|nr:glycosyltransferase family 4 protein [Actinomycetaceae bacterium]